MIIITIITTTLMEASSHFPFACLKLAVQNNIGLNSLNIPSLEPVSKKNGQMTWLLDASMFRISWSCIRYLVIIIIIIIFFGLMLRKDIFSLSLKVWYRVCDVNLSIENSLDFNAKIDHLWMEIYFCPPHLILRIFII